MIIAAVAKERMNRKSITIWGCGLLFCVSLFVAVTPITHIAGHSIFEFPPKVIATLVIGWDLIFLACFFLVKAKKRRRFR
jgi:hypothetical protein